jgi:hypothetical protein
MKKQMAFHQNAADSVGELNKLLNDGWIVVKMDTYRPFLPSQRATIGTFLVILEKEIEI